MYVCPASRGGRLFGDFSSSSPLRAAQIALRTLLEPKPSHQWLVVARLRVAHLLARVRHLVAQRTIDELLSERVPRSAQDVALGTYWVALVSNRGISAIVTEDAVDVALRHAHEPHLLVPARELLATFELVRDLVRLVITHLAQAEAERVQDQELARDTAPSSFVVRGSGASSGSRGAWIVEVSRNQHGVWQGVLSPTNSC